MQHDSNEQTAQQWIENDASANRYLSHVLIVDDDPFFRKILCRQLATLGFSAISTAENGEQALQQINDGSVEIELVFCDLQMPEMDGIAFLRHLTRTGFQGELVLMSGESERILSSVKKLADAHNIRLLGTLNKPFKLSEIEQLLTTKQSPATIQQKPGPKLLSRDEVKSGLESDALVLFYQPQIDCRDGSVAGVEVLMRWRTQDGQILPPLCVIPVAEQYGLIDQLTEKIFEQAMLQAKYWNNQGLDLSVSINLSMDNLQEPALYEKLNAHVSATGIKPASIVLEITESRLAVDMRGPLELMGRFKLMGYSLSIDDFGTGYSTMEQLSGFPFDELKIDRQFVKTALNDDASLSIIETSIALAKRLSMRVVAEGIETRDEWRLLREKGCDLAQGFLISRPLPASEFEHWYKHWGKSQLD